MKIVQDMLTKFLLNMEIVLIATWCHPLVTRFVFTLNRLAFEKPVLNGQVFKVF